MDSWELIKLLYNQFKNIYIESGKQFYIRIQRDINDPNSNYLRAQSDNLDSALGKIIAQSWNLLPDTTKEYLNMYKKVAELQEQMKYEREEIDATT